MRASFDAAHVYPTALFSFALVVVIGYGGSVLLGGLDVDALDGGHGGEGVDAHHGDHADAGSFAGFRRDRRRAHRRTGRTLGRGQGGAVAASRPCADGGRSRFASWATRS
jgi:hypothetical protein